MRSILALSCTALLAAAAACSNNAGALPCVTDLNCPLEEYCQADGFCGEEPTHADAGTDAGTDAGSDAGPRMHPGSDAGPDGG